jgi:hypothetical protein
MKKSNSIGGSNQVTGNPSLRTIINLAADLWDNTPFFISGFEF